MSCPIVQAICNNIQGGNLHEVIGRPLMPPSVVQAICNIQGENLCEVISHWLMPPSVVAISYYGRILR